MDAVKNKIVVVGDHSSNKQHIIQRITGNTTLLCDVRDDFLKYNWTIDTKYYIAPVEIISLPDTFPPQLGNIETSHLGSVCEALILLLVPEKKETFESIKGWIPFIEEHSPNILLCASVGQCNDVDKEMYMNWCIENGIEFVEIIDTDTEQTNKEQPPSSSDDEYPEREGIDRIIEALSSTIWPTLVKKGKTEKTTQDFLPILEQLQDLSIDVTDKLDEDYTFGEFNDASLTHNLSALQNFLNDIEEDTQNTDNVEDKVENFENALVELKKLREKAQSLSDEERRAFALKVVSSLMMNEDMEEDGK